MTNTVETGLARLLRLARVDELLNQSDYFERRMDEICSDPVEFDMLVLVVKELREAAQKLAGRDWVQVLEARS